MQKKTKEKFFFSLYFVDFFFQISVNLLLKKSKKIKILKKKTTANHIHRIEY